MVKSPLFTVFHEEKKRKSRVLGVPGVFLSTGPAQREGFFWGVGRPDE
jgi:hypothetical protein